MAQLQSNALQNFMTTHLLKKSLGICNEIIKKGES